MIQTYDVDQLTPVERIADVWIKRDDLCEIAEVKGGKVRTCFRLSQGAIGLVTAGSRSSPQVNIVAHIAKHLNIPCRVHTPQGILSPEVKMAKLLGAEVIQHKAGYNNVIVARAREDAKIMGWTNIPFGMECQTAVDETAKQVINIPNQVRRLVVPIGGGMSLCGILQGLENEKRNLPLLGIIVGAQPYKRFDKYAPAFWRNNPNLKLINAGVEYSRHINARINGIKLDPVYEAKCEKFLEAGDCLWIVGIRKTCEE